MGQNTRGDNKQDPLSGDSGDERHSNELPRASLQEPEAVTTAATGVGYETMPVPQYYNTASFSHAQASLHLAKVMTQPE